MDSAERKGTCYRLLKFWSAQALYQSLTRGSLHRKQIAFASRPDRPQTDIGHPVANGEKQ